MSASSINRKRLYFPAFRDSSRDSLSDSDDDWPVKKKRRNDGFIFSSILETAFVLKSKLQRMAQWFWDRKALDKVVRMAFSCGAAVQLRRNTQESDDDSVAENDNVIIEELDDDDDDDIQEIKENVNQDNLTSLVKKFGNSHMANDSVRPKQSINGAYSLDSPYNCLQLNGANGRPLSTRCHGTTDCNLRRDPVVRQNPKSVFNNPATEIDVLLSSEPEVITIDGEGDGIEILSESKSSKPIKSTPIKALHSSVNSSTPEQAQSPSDKNSSRKIYTANDVVRLQEKAQYKLLLEKYVTGKQYCPAFRKRESIEEITDNPGALSNSHFTKEILTQPVNSFMEKYYSPCRLLPRIVESSEAKKEPETVTISDDEKEAPVIEMNIPSYKYKACRSKMFSPSWLSELQRNVISETEKRNKVVEDYECKLEKFKKERLLKRLLPEKVDKDFPALAPEIDDAIDKVFTNGSPEDFICKTVNGIELRRKDICTLNGLQWLNDSIINAYFDLIVIRSKNEGFPKVFTFNTFFYGNIKSSGHSSVKRWTRKVDLFSFDMILVPLHLSFHWCLAIIDNRSKKVLYFDSMGTGEKECLGHIHSYICTEHEDKKKEILDPSVYTKEIVRGIPQQMNGSDCGVFTLKYAEYYSRNARINFEQKHMQYFRRKAAYEILTNQLL